MSQKSNSNIIVSYYFAGYYYPLLMENCEKMAIESLSDAPTYYFHMNDVSSCISIIDEDAAANSLCKDHIVVLDDFCDSDITNILESTSSKYKGKIRYVIVTSDDTININHERIQVPSYSVSEKEEFINWYLSPYAKILSNNQVRAIADCHLSDNLTNLKVVLERLIAYGDFDSLAQYISKLTSICDVKELYSFLLDEADDAFGKDVTQNFLAHIASSRCGVYEKDFAVTKCTTLQCTNICYFFKYLINEIGGVYYCDNELFATSIMEHYYIEDSSIYKRALSDYYYAKIYEPVRRAFNHRVNCYNYPYEAWLFADKLEVASKINNSYLFDAMWWYGEASGDLYAYALQENPDDSDVREWADGLYQHYLELKQILNNK